MQELITTIWLWERKEYPVKRVSDSMLNLIAFKWQSSSDSRKVRYTVKTWKANHEMKRLARICHFIDVNSKKTVCKWHLFMPQKCTTLKPLWPFVRLQGTKANDSKDSWRWSAVSPTMAGLFIGGTRNALDISQVCSELQTARELPFFPCHDTSLCRPSRRCLWCIVECRSGSRCVEWLCDTHMLDLEQWCGNSSGVSVEKGQNDSQAMTGAT